MIVENIHTVQEHANSIAVVHANVHMGILVKVGKGKHITSEVVELFRTGCSQIERLPVAILHERKSFPTVIRSLHCTLDTHGRVADQGSDYIVTKLHVSLFVNLPLNSNSLAVE